MFLLAVYTRAPVLCIFHTYDGGFFFKINIAISVFSSPQIAMYRQFSFTLYPFYSIFILSLISQKDIDNDSEDEMCWKNIEYLKCIIIVLIAFFSSCFSPTTT